MKLRLWRIGVASWVFIALSVGSAVYLSLATLNYLSFYPSLAHLQPSTLKISLQGNTSANLSFLAQISVSNPSGYSGFTLEDLSLKVYLTASSNSSSSLFATGAPEASQVVARPLTPHSTFFSNIVIPLNPQEAESLLNFNRTYNGRITAHADLTITIITFLDPVMGRIPIESMDILPLT